MAGIGAELPPHLLAKRKRKQEEEAEDAATTASGAKRSTSSGEGEKRRKVIGPAMPPASLEERPDEPPNGVDESDDDSDDGFGPALPSTDQNADSNSTNGSPGAGVGQTEETALDARPKRDDWMMMPPKQDDLAARMDPTKQRARGFATGKGARGPNTQEQDSSAWHETPEQKQKRLADEMMGVSRPQTGEQTKSTKRSDTARDEAAACSIREHTVRIAIALSSSIAKLHLLTHDTGEESRSITTRPTQAKQRLRSGGR